MKTQIELPNTRPTHYIVQEAESSMPKNCWGHYRHVAVLEVEFDRDRVAMISTRAKGLVRIVWDSGARNVGKTERCTFAKARKEADSRCRELNKRCPFCGEEHLDANDNGGHRCYKCNHEWIMDSGKILVY